MTTVQELVGEARVRLVRAGLEPDQAGIDAEVLARNTLGWDRATYLAEGRVAAPADFLRRYERVLERRERREPVSLITGHREFWGLDFEVTPDVLTPRSETEILVEEAVSCLRGHGLNRAQVVDVGTGSGCLAVSVALEVPDCHVTAVDVSIEALRVARRNAARHGVANRMRWICAPLLEGLAEARDPTVIVANLPYVPESEMESLPPEVREYEPPGALTGGLDGLDAIRALVDQTDRYLGHGGWLVLECGSGQSESVCRHVSSVNGRAARDFHHGRLEVVKIHDDLQGIPRVLVVQKH